MLVVSIQGLQADNSLTHPKPLTCPGHSDTTLLCASGSAGPDPTDLPTPCSLHYPSRPGNPRMGGVPSTISVFQRAKDIKLEINIQWKDEMGFTLLHGHCNY